MEQKRLIAAVALLCLFVAGSALADVTGGISGVITDSQTKEPLVGVTVAVEGTNLGAITDVNGAYKIINVPVNPYVLRISAVGYATLEVEAVNVSADFVNYQSHDLSKEAADIGKTIRVTAEQPLVVPDKTASVNVVGQEQILALPTRGFEQVVGIQNSVVQVQTNASVRQRGGREESQSGEIFVRGGRRSEVAYYVDGFSQQDPLSGLSTANISNNSIKEVSIIAGGFPAEYGHVASGIVNTVTASGTPEFQGTLEAVTDQKYAQNWYSATLGGPIPGLSNAFFFGSGERRWFGDREPSILNDALPGSPDRKPHNTLDGWSAQGKVNWKLTPQFEVLFSGNWSQDQWQQYAHTYLFNQAHMPWYDDENLGLNAKITHTLGANTFYNLAATYFVTKRFRGDGVYRRDLSQYDQPGDNPRFASRALFWLPDHVWDDYLKRKSSYLGFKGDVNAVISRDHTVKVGAEFQRHTLRFYQHYFPARLNTDPNNANRYGYDLAGEEIEEETGGLNKVKHPINVALFAQDRFEWRGLIMNAGVRFDLFDYNARRIINDRRPFDPDNLQDANSQTLEIDSDLEDSEVFTRVSPRLGIAFPVSPTTQVRMNYGKFFQRPDLVNLYVGDTFLEWYLNREGYFVPIGNPNLEPEKTTQYEVGLTHQLGENTVLDIAAFYKDVVDLVQVFSIPASPGQYSTYFNQDFGTVKGLDFAFTMRRTKNIYLNVKYTLSYARGTGSFAQTQQNIAWQASEPPKQSSPLDFDQRHSLIANVDWRTGRGGGPKVGDVYPLENFGVNFLVTAGSGLPFSPSEVFNEVTLAASAPTPEAPRNSRYADWTWQIDMKAEKTFNFGSYSIVPFLWVKNLLDIENTINVYEATGEPNTTNWLETEAGQAYIDANTEVDDNTHLTGEQEYLLKENHPGNYGIPRQIILGLRVTF
jgi:outer membrane receptor protein involved in Fe transport